MKMVIMRLLVMFDLPTGNSQERKEYAKFRKFLLEDGFLMEQFSVYSRMTIDRNNLDTHVKRIENHLPPAGSVQVLEVTEHQYEKRKLLVSKLKPSKNKKEKTEREAQLSLFF